MFKKLVDHLVAELHEGQPVLIPGIKLGGLDAGDGWAQGAMGSCTVHTNKNTKIQ